MLTFDDIATRWNNWSRLPFPAGVHEIEWDATDLINIDTFSAGCISTYVGNRGKLDQKRIDVLRGCTVDLDVVLPDLTGDIRDYFSELLVLSQEVLKACSSR